MRQTWINFVLLCAVLSGPVLMAYVYLGQLGFWQFSAVVAGAVAAVLLMWVCTRLPPLLCAGTVLLVSALMTLLRWAYVGNVHFSGEGFSSEFFIHLDWQSVLAAWYMYSWQLLLVLLLFALVVGLMVVAVAKMRRPGKAPALGVLLLAPALWWFAAAQQPETQFLQQARTWYGPGPAIPELTELQARWRDHPLVEVELVSKRHLFATAPTTPKNLILIYLESVGSSIINHPDWPDLLPYLTQLEQNNSLVNDFHSSAFITIEGIVNSQCGTLFPFDRGSDSLVSSNNLAEQMPCLGDILQRAGYELHYYGGADIAFAGKGDFLRAHGFPNPLGIEYWREQGLDQRPGTWGLSDADLYLQARQMLLERRESQQPFALTLLTIGTHIPGFFYDECVPYEHSDNEFLNALHCTDQLLQQWLAQLTEDGLLDNTLVVITADHQVFRNAEMHSLFGEEAVYDHRLPLIVLDGKTGVPPATAEWGALYDLAPTVLDLLNVEHNARFALGRSLLQPVTRPYYTLNRYRHLYRGQESRAGRSACPDPSAEMAHADLTVPLSICAKVDLENLLHMQIRALSSSRTGLDCTRPFWVAVPQDPEQKLEVVIAGRSAAGEFTRRGRQMVGNEPGLYGLSFSADGSIEYIQYVPAAEARSLSLMASPITRSWFFVWRGDAQHQPPDWLPEAGAERAVWFGHGAPEALQWTVASAEPGENLEWHMPSTLCEQLL